MSRGFGVVDVMNSCLWEWVYTWWRCTRCYSGFCVDTAGLLACLWLSFVLPSAAADRRVHFCSSSAVLIISVIIWIKVVSHCFSYTFRIRELRSKIRDP